jgi:translation initiation factor 6
MVIIPPQVLKSEVKKLEEWLKVKPIQTTIGESVLVGALACANSNGIILPHIVQEKEVQVIKSSLDINITVMETKKTAYGNLVLANDRGAMVDPRLKNRDVKKIMDTLGVETVRSRIAGLPYVGSLAATTNKGALAHPLLTEDEQKSLMNVLKVNVDVGTVNCGIPYVAMGLIGNSHGVVAGSVTTGPELFVIGQALDVVNENG